MSENRCFLCGEHAEYTLNKNFFMPDKMEFRKHTIYLCEKCKIGNDIHTIYLNIKGREKIEVDLETAKYEFNLKKACGIRISYNDKISMYLVQIIYENYIAEIFYDKNTLNPIIAGVKYRKTGK
jgi:hypothetical protein